MILNKGVYPTMITPYTKDNKIDFDGVDKIVEFYYKNGCEGIFAVCQSSEMAFLSLDERVALAKRVVDAAKKAPYKMNVVASGHDSFDLDQQIEEIKAVLSHLLTCGVKLRYLCLANGFVDYHFLWHHSKSDVVAVKASVLLHKSLGFI